MVEEFVLSLNVKMFFGDRNVEHALRSLSSKYSSVLIITDSCSAANSALCKLDLGGQTILRVPRSKVGIPIVESLLSLVENLGDMGVDCIIGVGGLEAIAASKLIYLMLKGSLPTYLDISIRASEGARSLVTFPLSLVSGLEADRRLTACLEKSHAIIERRVWGIPCTSLISPGEISSGTTSNILELVNALSYAVEGLANAGGSSFSEELLSLVLRGLVGEALGIARGKACGKEVAVYDVLLAIALDTSGASTPHALAYAVSAILQEDFRKMLPPLLVSWLRHLERRGEEEVKSYLARIRAGLELSGELSALLDSLLSDLSVYRGLSEHGLSENKVDWIVENAISFNRSLLGADPSNPSRSDLEEIVLEAM